MKAPNGSSAAMFPQYGASKMIYAFMMWIDLFGN